MSLTDNLGRKINYLRLSVTDRCNMRCVYCMPASGITKHNHAEMLSFEQLVLIAEASVSLGIEKLRVTGGEPLVRKGIIDLLAMLANVRGLRHLVLTTNGVNLAPLAQQLKDAGVQRLNISLDSLQPEMFKQLTRRDYLTQVLAGIEAAEKVGLDYKINMVVMRGCNDNELLDFANLTKETNCTVRFIEYMPTLKDKNWQSLVVTSGEVLEQLRANYRLQLLEREVSSGPAQEFAIAGAKGRLGVISPLDGHFCRDCNRIRITASGKVKTCLFSATEFDLKPLLQSKQAETIAKKLKQLIDNKPACHELNSKSFGHSPFSMAQIGG